jgi:radical SAM-linked protein
MVQQRFRVRFRKAERVRYISHLDVLRAWERSIRRAGLPLTYSQGFTPHPKIAFASPLPLGFVGEAEIMDVTLDERVEACEFEERLAAQTTDDLALLSAVEVPAVGPPPQATLLWSDYEVAVTGVSADEAEDVVSGFLALDVFDWTEDRNERTRRYNLREGVGLLAVERRGDTLVLRMRLKSDKQMTARPEQVVAALFPGAVAGVYRRVGLVLEESSPALEAWRRVGQFQ